VSDRPYWGDLHLNLHHPGMDQVDEVFAMARDHLDFFPIAYYPYDYAPLPGGLHSESIGLSDQALRDWERIEEAVRAHHEPGRFVTFPGYEWHGNRRSGGDHNVFYLEQGPLALPDTLPELYQHCRATGAIAIPHHTAYRTGPGSRGKDWDLHDEELSPVAEIFSHHGCSEAVDAPLPLARNRSMGPRVSGGTIQEGLARGYRVGIIASGDSHEGFPGVWGRGLAAVWAEALTREAIWRAIRERRVYGVTGDRMVVDFRIGDVPMGGELRAEGEIEIAASVTGEAAIDRIELLRNNRVIATYCHAGTWDHELAGSPGRAKLRICMGWGPGEEYGLRGGERKWRGRLKILGGEIQAAQGCFTRGPQRLRPAGRDAWEWEITTSGRSNPEENIQGIVFALAGESGSRLLLEVEGERVEFTLGEALAKSRVVPLLDEARAAIADQFGIDTDKMDNPDSPYHNARKVKPQLVLSARLPDQRPDGLDLAHLGGALVIPSSAPRSGGPTPGPPSCPRRSPTPRGC